MSLVREVKIEDRTYKFEFNRFAKQTNGTVMITCGGTQVLVTVCAASEAKEGQDFFPLTVDYIEKFYSCGRIPGGYLKREGKPSDRETLTARVIDRPLRPSFPDGYLCDTFVTCTVVSLQEDIHPAPLALIGASTALTISDIPFNGPLASLRIGMVDGKLMIDPPQNEPNDLDLTVAASEDAILMVEAGANFLSEEQMLDAIDYAHKSMQPFIQMQKEVQAEIGKTKREVSPHEINPEIISGVAKYKPEVVAAFSVKDKIERYAVLKAISKKAHTELNPDGDSKVAFDINSAIDEMKYKEMRGMILAEKKRIDGRNFTEIRNITCDIRPLVRPHGSALFTRGETQALGAVTLGSKDDEKRFDSIFNSDGRDNFMLHYNFPPYSVGEARPMRHPGRREIGHGALAHKAVSPIIPDSKEFGYTLRIVSEILESNGSSSMATVCASTMAMLDAGVPIKEPVSGIAMGLVKEGDDYAILSDILGDEDHLGDMDFKVCGGSSGITALQMDIKIGGLSREILVKALEQAKEGRMHILGKMTDAISKPASLSEFAPRIIQMKIKSDKIRDLIGPGGKTIKKLTAETGVKIDIEDDGVVNIVSPDVAAAEKAKRHIAFYTTEPKAGEIYLGTVKKVVDFGAFVEIKPGVEGLCHISNLANERVAKTTDVVNEGEEILVKLLEIDRQGKMKLSRKDALDQKPTVHAP
jgi:polyribonucleotide nucleotidyltransferase